MTDVEKQNEFVKSLAKFFSWLELEGYQVSLGEAFRPNWVAEIYATQGKGVKNSLHTKRLAIDLNLFINGAFLIQKEDYRKAGTYWESLSAPELTHCWGGNFSIPDSDHFSISDGGVK